MCDTQQTLPFTGDHAQHNGGVNVTHCPGCIQRAERTVIRLGGTIASTERKRIVADLKAIAAHEYNAPSQGEEPLYSFLLDLAGRYERGEHDR